MTTALNAGPVSSVTEAIDQMRALDDQLPDDDGVKAFNRMYLQVTEAVLNSRDLWQDRTFLDALDVVFANLFFSGMSSLDGDGEKTHCWEVLAEHRYAEHVAPAQFAIAGMNAHINHDLVLAVVKTCEELGGAPHHQGWEDDYERVNDLLGKLEESIRPALLHGVLAETHGLLGRLEDALACWSIAGARRTAWCNAEFLWHVRKHERISADYLKVLDLGTATLSRFLLAPLEMHARHVSHPQWHPRASPDLPSPRVDAG
jgi:hypothetical protein